MSAIKHHKKFIWLMLLALFAFSFTVSGCKTNEPTESSMPWAQPAEWEKQNMLQKMGAGF
jgi:hypothetical protein